MEFDPLVRPHRGPIKTEERRISDPQTLQEALGVSRDSFVTYHRQCVKELERIQGALPALMRRHTRAHVAALVEKFDAIIRNLEGDPDDMRVENALPIIMRRVASVVEEYVPLASQHRSPKDVTERMAEIEKMLKDGAQWLDQVLERMRSNDGHGIEARVRVLSDVFSSSIRPTLFETSRVASEEADTHEGER